MLGNVNELSPTKRPAPITQRLLPIVVKPGLTDHAHVVILEIRMHELIVVHIRRILRSELLFVLWLFNRHRISLSSRTI